MRRALVGSRNGMCVTDAGCAVFCHCPKGARALPRPEGTWRPGPAQRAPALRRMGLATDEAIA